MLARTVLALSLGVAVTILALFKGGFAPTSWGWGALLALWVSILALVFQEIRVGSAGRAWFGALVSVAGWTALSATWSMSEPRTMLALERDLLYVAVVMAVLLLWRPQNAVPVLICLTTALAGVVVYSLGRYLLASPHFDPTQGFSLFEPVGYANAVGGLIAMALPLLLAFAAYGAHRGAAALAAGTAVMLTVALYLTQNRSGWLALALAIVVWLFRTSERSRAFVITLATLVLAGFAVVAVSALDLFNTDASLGELGRHRLASAGIVIAFAGAAAFVPRLRHLELSERVVRRATQAAAVVPAGAFCVALTHLNERGHYWRVAWDDFNRHPLLGSGAGTFDELWYRYRDVDRTVQNAHSLYLETLGELGLVGLLLVLALLALPIVLSRRTRDPLFTAALAAYSGFLVHAGFEWDWQMPVVTVSALILGSTLVLSEPRPLVPRLAAPARIGAALTVAALTVFVVVTLAGNSFTVSAEHRILAGDIDASAARARRAKQLLPWASEPWLVIADTRSRTGDSRGARTAMAQALSRDRFDWTLYLRLALISSGEQRAAALRHAVELNPMLSANLGKSR